MIAAEAPVRKKPVPVYNFPTLSSKGYRLGDVPPLEPERKRLIRRTLRRIERYPTALDMGTWLEPANTPCNTVGCFAGHLVVSAFPKLDPRGWNVVRLPGDSRAKQVSEVARKLLGLSDKQSTRLFAAGYWPTQFYDRYNTRKTPKARARVLRQRIEHWMETGE